MQYDKKFHELVSRRLPRLRASSPRTILIGIAGVFLVGLFLFRLIGSGGEGRRPQPTPPVRVAMSEMRDVPVVIHTIGTVLANATVAVKSQIDGQLLSANFSEGQMVKAGDILFRIDPKPIEASLRQANALLEQQRAQLASASSDAARANQLAQRGIVSAQQRDQLVANAKALSAGTEANKAAADRARLQLSYTTIRAPMDGKTGSILVHPGNLVKANDTNPLVVLTQIQPVKISFSLPQSYLPALQDRMREKALIATLSIHQEAGIAAVIGPQDTIEVNVDFIGNTIENSTGTVELRANFNNPDLRLVPGELVDVGVKVNTVKNAIVVPRNAVNNGQQGTYVYAIGADHKATVHPVTIAYQNEDIAALSSGIDKGMRVVTDGQLRLTPGITVSLPGEKGGAGGKNAKAGRPSK